MTAISNTGQNTPTATIANAPAINKPIKTIVPKTLKTIASAINTNTTHATADAPIAFNGSINSPEKYTKTSRNYNKLIPKV